MTKRSYQSAEQVAHMWANDGLDREFTHSRIAYSSNAAYRVGYTSNPAHNVTVLEFISYRTAIAYQVVHPTLPRLFILDSHRHSVTTSKHQQYLRMAVRGGYYSLDGFSFDMHFARKVAKTDIERLEVKLIKAKAKAQDYFEERRRIADNFNTVRAKLIEYGFTHVADEITLSNEAIGEVKVRSATEQANAEERRRLALIEREKQEAVQFAKDNASHALWLDWWRGGSTGDRPEGASRHFHNSADIAVRRSPDGKNLQTSGGAEVPFRQASALFRLIHEQIQQKGKVELYMSGGAIGSFTVKSVASNGDLTVGCHFIAYEEMKRLALELNIIES